MTSTRKNALPELVELTARLERVGDIHSLRTELRVGTAEIDSDDGDFVRLSARRLDLKVDLEGAEIQAGTRFGEPIRSGEVKTKIQDKRELIDKVGGGGKVEASVSPNAQTGALSLGVDARRDLTNTSTRQTEREETDRLVTARGNNKWEISEFNPERLLNGTYTFDDVELCRIARQVRANRSYVNVTAEIRQRDIFFDHSGCSLLNRLNFTKSRIAEVLIAKAISNEIEQYVGKIALSSVEIDLED